MVESTTPPQPGRAAWLALLDECEASMGEAALVSGGLVLDATRPPWSPPVALGPIPADLEDRAREILGGQRELMAELRGERKLIGEQLAALRQVPSPQARAVYLDITG